MIFLQKELFLIHKHTNALSKNELYEKIYDTILYKDIELMIEYERANGLEINELKTYSCYITNENYIHQIPTHSKFDDVWNIISSYGQIKQINDKYYFVYDYDNNRYIIIHIYPVSSLHIYDWDRYIYNIDIKFSIYFIPNNKSIKVYFKDLDLNTIFHDIVLSITTVTFLHKMAIKIQKNCQNWLWKPICNDGKPGINMKLGWKYISDLHLLKMI